MRNLFWSKRKGNVINDKTLVKIVTDIKNLFESHEEVCYEPIRIGNAFDDNFFNMKVIEIKTKLYQLNKMLIRLDHI